MYEQDYNLISGKMRKMSGVHVYGNKNQKEKNLKYTTIIQAIITY